MLFKNISSIRFFALLFSNKKYFRSFKAQHPGIEVWIWSPDFLADCQLPNTAVFTHKQSFTSQMGREMLSQHNGEKLYLLSFISSSSTTMLECLKELAVYVSQLVHTLWKYPPSGISDSTCFYSEAWFESRIKCEVYNQRANPCFLLFETNRSFSSACYNKKIKFKFKWTCYGQWVWLYTTLFFFSFQNLCMNTSKHDMKLE